MADQGYTWLFGHRSKFVGAVLAYGLYSVFPLCLWHNNAATAAVATWDAV